MARETFVSKAEFVRSRPYDEPPDEVIAYGAKLGLDVKRHDIDAARLKMRREAEAKRAKDRERKAKARAGASPKMAAVQGQAGGIPGSVHKFLADYIPAHGHGPSAEEMASALGFKEQQIRKAMISLREKGAIAYDRADYRSVTILWGPRASSTMPPPPATFSHAPRALLNGGPPPYLGALEADLKARIGERAYEGEDTGSLVAAAKAVLDCLRGKRTEEEKAT